MGKICAMESTARLGSFECKKNSELSYFEVSVQKRYCAITDIEIKRRDVILPILLNRSTAPANSENAG